MNVRSDESCKWEWAGGESLCGWSVTGDKLRIVNYGLIPVPSLATATLYGVKVEATVTSENVPPECKIVGSTT